MYKYITSCIYPSRQQLKNKKKGRGSALLAQTQIQPSQTPPVQHPLLNKPSKSQLILTTLGLACTVTGVSVLKSANGNFEPDLRVHHCVLHWLVT